MGRMEKSGSYKSILNPNLDYKRKEKRYGTNQIQIRKNL